MLLALAVLTFTLFYLRRERLEKAERELGKHILKDYVYRTVEVPESAGPR